MSWLFFMDESGHDHRRTPYEVRGGFALEDSAVWPFVRQVEEEIESAFGVPFSEYATEIKGSSLLKKSHFRWARQAACFDEEKRRRCSSLFLQKSRGKRETEMVKDEFTAYGQACLFFVKRLLGAVRRHRGVVFASLVPAGIEPPEGFRYDYFLRKDHVFLFERFFDFLAARRQQGIIVMDEYDDEEDRRFLARMRNYFTRTANGRDRARLILPLPLFVSSHMAIPVQVADVVVYCINWGYRRFRGATTLYREEVRDLSEQDLYDLAYHSEGGKYGIFCVANPFAGSAR